MEHELLLEIGMEEIPAGFIGPALQDLEDKVAKGLAELDLTHGGIYTVATPRRLALCVQNLADRQPDRQDEFLGPPRSAAYDANNKPTKAAIGFAASKGACVDDLKVVTTPKGEYLSLVMDRKGEASKDLLVTLLPDIIQRLSFPKSMRWGKGSISFARPIHWLLALYGGKVVPFSIGSIASGSTTRGHRFMAPAEMDIQNFDQYVSSLQEASVLVDFSVRRQKAFAEVTSAATLVGGEILPDEELLDTVTNLVESPYGICGTFEQRFLALPDSVLITAMREHQKYFCVMDKDGKLMANFIAVNNTKVKDNTLAAEGHQRVIRARLEDAFFFFRDDQTRKLAERVDNLSGIVFQNKLGTMLEKTERLQKLSVFLAEKLVPDAVDDTERAAMLAKTDLLTAMVNEFPSLQGVMGRDYALLDGEKEEVATAILEHYLPIRAGDKLPQGTIGALVSMADRLDSIAGCFGIGQVPTGTTDPYGLRRLALGLIRIIEDRAFSLSLQEFADAALELYGGKLNEDLGGAKTSMLEFIKGRYVNDLVARGVPAEAVEAVTSVSFDDIVDCRARIDALTAIMGQPTFTMLAAAFKRVMNIIKDNDHQTEVRHDLLQDEGEKELYRTFLSVADEANPLLANKDYAKALAVILRMKEPVDRFFDSVMVMAEDPALRQNRLNLLNTIAVLFLRVGDFSKMQGRA